MRRLHENLAAQVALRLVDKRKDDYAAVAFLSKTILSKTILNFIVVINS